MIESKNVRFFSPTVCFCQLSAGMSSDEKARFPFEPFCPMHCAFSRKLIILKHTIFFLSFLCLPKFSTDPCLPREITRNNAKQTVITHDIRYISGMLNFFYLILLYRGLLEIIYLCRYIDTRKPGLKYFNYYNLLNI